VGELTDGRAAALTAYRLLHKPQIALPIGCLIHAPGQR
jgi:hypothetical protein